MKTETIKKPKCKFCNNDATTHDWRNVDGQTSKVLSCDDCIIIPTDVLLARNDKK
jgi:hypothetical protein